MNNTNFIGRLVRDPELRYTPNGVAVASFTVAVDRKVKAEGQPEADFIPCVAWRTLAEVLTEHCHKGREIGVSGEIHTRSYEHAEKGVQYVVEVVADDIRFLREPKGNDDQAAIEESSNNNRGTNSSSTRSGSGSNTRGNSSSGSGTRSGAATSASNRSASGGNGRTTGNRGGNR